MRRVPLLTVFVLLFASCSEKPLLEITTSTRYDAYNSILFLTESANIALIEDSSELAKYLTDIELKTAFDSIDNAGIEPKRSRRFEYRFYGNQVTNEKFDADLILFQDMTKHGRDYHFQLRAYNKKRDLIDNLDFAIGTMCLI